MYQQSRIRQAEDAAWQAEHDVLDQGFAVKELERQVERLTVAVIALAELLRDRHGIPDEEIEAKMREVEHRGVTVHPKAKRCSECGRLSGPKHTNCMFCGKPLASEPFLPDTKQEQLGSE